MKERSREVRLEIWAQPDHLEPGKLCQRIWVFSLWGYWRLKHSSKGTNNLIRIPDFRDPCWGIGIRRAGIKVKNQLWRGFAIIEAKMITTLELASDSKVIWGRWLQRYSEAKHLRLDQRWAMVWKAGPALCFNRVSSPETGAHPSEASTRKERLVWMGGWGYQPGICWVWGVSGLIQER